MTSDADNAHRAGERLLRSRTRLLFDHGFFGLLLMYMRFALDDTIDTAATDGTFIYFSPVFLENLSDEELDFIMMHEAMHAALAHIVRGQERNEFVFNVACDIVVNSIIIKEMNRRSFILKKFGPAMHLTPTNKEGYLYSAEEIYEMLKKDSFIFTPGARGFNGKDGSRETSGVLDDHSRWGRSSGDDKNRAVWRQRVLAAAKAMEHREKDCGRLPLFAKRLIGQLSKPKIDWRTVLQNFIQEETFDYSFQPPDKRHQDSDFILPDFNDRRDMLRNVVFYVDASGSVTNKELSEAMSEIVGAVEQFGGCMTGHVAFFDAKVSQPAPFEDTSELDRTTVYGGGGTSFHAVFNNLREFAENNQVSCAIVLTDGYAPYPDQSAAVGIPVLWIINNQKQTPPWGRIARMD